MIVKKNRYYYGLHLIETAVTDTSSKSPNYLKIDSVPDQLTSGKNVIKLLGNVYKFAKDAILYAEVLDSQGTVVYSEIPEYSDSLNRKFLIINVTDEVAPGPAQITIVSTLRDELVPANFRGRINFKWSVSVNISKFISNQTDIVAVTPPEVILQTRIRPFVPTTFRNNEETATREYGDYEFSDFPFTDYIGDTESSNNIFQKDDAYKKLAAFTSASITSYNRNNVFFLTTENYSAKSVNKNYSDIIPGSGFNIQFGPNVIRSNAFDDPSQWIFDSGWTIEPNPTWTNRFNVAAPALAPIPGLQFYFGQNVVLTPNQYYLLAFDYDARMNLDLNVYLGYDSNYQSGSISENVSISYTNLNGTDTAYSILRASNGGPFLWFASPNVGPGMVYIDNVRLYPLTSLGYDFKHESDANGGYIKIHNPIITPETASNVTLLPSYQGSQIVPGDPAYVSYVNFIHQDKNAAVEDKFVYNVIPKEQISNPQSYQPKLHAITKFVSNPIINQTNLEDLFSDTYAQEFILNEPNAPSILLNITPTDLSSKFYGTFYIGGSLGEGGIYEYDTLTDTFTVLRNFGAAPNPSNPDTKLLYLPTGPSPGLYGTTINGGLLNSGSMFRYDLNTGNFARLKNFGQPNSASGYFPAGPLMQASNGLLYGTTSGPVDAGGGYGVLYSFSTSSRAYTVIHQTGSYGPTNLIELNGLLWGTTAYGGAGGEGTIFTINLTTNAFTTEYTFIPVVDGTEPRGLTLGSDGKFYGITYVDGVIFSYESGSAAPTPLYYLDPNTEGSNCEEPLFEDSGYLYGVCSTGATHTSGSIFRYNLDPLAVTPFEVLHEFTGGADGEAGKCSIIRIGNSLYGTTTAGGSGYGTIFRLDRSGINRPYIEKESGIIYHRNSIVPYEIPATSSLLLDYPRWTGPVVVGGEGNLYSIIELEIKNLEPLTGDISKVQLYAKPKGVKSEFVDLGIYPTAPIDVLLDNNYVNHVQFVDSPYRLTGYFKPTITTVTENPLEASAFKSLTFLNGWATGSVTNSYFQTTDFETYISISQAPQANLPYGSTLAFNLTANPTDNALAYAVYTKSALIPVSTSANIWEQISYNLFSAAPSTIGMDTGSFNYYTASSDNNITGLNSVLMYAGLVTKTSSIEFEDIYAVSPNLNNWYDITGSISASSGCHPLTFNGKLGWKTDTFMITASVAETKSLYPALFFEYNTINDEILVNTIDSTHPHILEVSNFLCREVGDRDYIRDKYWEWYTYPYGNSNTLVTTASVSANTDILIDSTKLTATDDSRGLGYLYNNRLVFKTIDSYRFYKGVPYIVSFNAVSKIDRFHALGSKEPIVLDLIAKPGVVPGLGSLGWTDAPGNAIKKTFDTSRYGVITPADYDFYIGDYKIDVTFGSFTYSTLENPTRLVIEFEGNVAEFENIQPNSTYSAILNNPTTSGAPSDQIGPKLILSSSFTDPNASLYITNFSITRCNYDRISNSNVSPILPSKSKLRVFGMNTSFGVPFADQLATPEIGEFIGELDHTFSYSSGETKNFGRIEMEFEAEADGFGFIAFETDLGAEWYIADVSVKPKDRVGETPGVTKLFVKIPNDLVNKPLTFKVEYLNDLDIKAPYNTILNDVVFSNVNEQQSENKSSVNTGTVPTTDSNNNISGPNTIADSA